MEKGKINKGLLICFIIIIAILIVIILLLLQKVSTKEDNIKSKNISYEIKTVEIGKVAYKQDDSGPFSDVVEDKNGTLFVKYPVLSGESDYIKEINTDILDKVNNTLGDFNKSDATPDNYCYSVSLITTSDMTTVYHNDLAYQVYNVYETDDYLIITETYEGVGDCSEGFTSFKNIFTIDKKTGEKVENSNFKSKLDNNSLNTYLEKKFYSETAKDIEETINNDDYEVYMTSNNSYDVVVNYSLNYDYLIFSFDGNTWSEK